jgi:hypothetical protein
VREAIEIVFYDPLAFLDDRRFDVPPEERKEVDPSLVPFPRVAWLATREQVA